MLVHGLVRRGSAGEPSRRERGRPGAGEIGLVEACRRDRKSVRATLPADAAGRRAQGCCVPMVSGSASSGPSTSTARRTTFQPDSSDVMFLGGLASAARGGARARAARRAAAPPSGGGAAALEPELENLRRSLQEARLLHKSSAMDALLAVARRVAPTDATVLVTGESGTGKELLARTIHEMSPRRKGPFVVVDCGALPPTLMESELFGHERGAFTGADSRRAGRLAEAERGTVVLDEIGELPLELQAKLLRFVQERHVTPVGGRPRPVDARLVAATHRDLRGDVAAGRFRQDLFYRLNVVHLELPPLRERPEDVLHLAEHYLERYALLYGRPARRLSAEAEAEALRHPWPGNVRELQNRIMQAVILGEGEEIRPAELLGLPASPGPARAGRTRLAAAAALLPQGRGRAVERAAESGSPRTLSDAASLGPAAAPPLGRWLEDDLVLAAHAAAGGVLRRAAASPVFPRRRSAAATSRPRTRLSRGREQRGPGWQEVRRAAAAARRGAAGGRPSRLDRSAEELLRLVESHATGRRRAGAARMLGDHAADLPAAGRGAGGPARQATAEARRSAAKFGASCAAIEPRQEPTSARSASMDATDSVQ